MDNPPSYESLFKDKPKMNINRMNRYSCFYKEKNKEYRNKYPNKTGHEINMKIQKKWKQMENDEKEEYDKKAQKEYEQKVYEFNLKYGT